MNPTVLTRLLLTGGAVASAGFVLVFLVDGATRSGYDPMAYPVSALSLGERGWLQTANFVVCGTILLGLAVGLRRALRPGKGARWAPILIGVFAIGLVLSGAFRMDPTGDYPPGVAAPDDASWHAAMHDLAGLLVFVSLPIACFVLARWFASAGRVSWALYSVATGLVLAVLVVGFGVAWEEGSAYAGLWQRAAIVIGWGWLALVAMRLRRAVPGLG